MADQDPARYWHYESTGVNELQRRRWRRYWIIRCGLALTGSLALVVAGVQLVGVNPVFLLLALAGLIVAYRVLRSTDAALRTDPVPPPP